MYKSIEKYINKKKKRKKKGRRKTLLFIDDNCNKNLYNVYNHQNQKISFLKNKIKAAHTHTMSLSLILSMPKKEEDFYLRDLLFY